MNKKILAPMLALGVLLGTTTPALAYERNGNVNLGHSINKHAISSQTVITEDNIYDVLDYVGVDKSKFTKSDKPQEGNNVITTAGQLKQVVDNFNRMSTEPIEINKENFDNHRVKREPPEDRVERGTRTKHSFTKMGSCELDISGTGDYEKVISVWSGNNSFKWTSAGGADVRINSSDWMTSHTLKSIDRCDSSIDSSGKLRVDYKANIEYFAVAKWGPLSLGVRTAQGFKTWVE